MNKSSKEKPKPQQKQTPTLRRFGEMAWGTKFKERGRENPRSFIKLQNILPSGLHQRVYRLVAEPEGKETQPHKDDFFNAVDQFGILGKCPDWLEFEVLEWSNNPIDRACLDLRGETLNAIYWGVDPREKLKAGDYLEWNAPTGKLYRMIGEDMVGKIAGEKNKWGGVETYIRLEPRSSGSGSKK